MMCFSAKRKITAYVDERLRERDRVRVQEHLGECDRCAVYFDDIGNIRAGLQGLPHPKPPDSLKLRLRILASREQQALTQRNGSRLLAAWENWRFRMHNLMRPLTIPATGGILSSLLLCATFAFAVATSTRGVAYEVPLSNDDHTVANLVPMSVRSSVFLNISLDGHGHIQDYVVRDAKYEYSGDAGSLVANDISLPNFPVRAISGDISILVTPIVYRQ